MAKRPRLAADLAPPVTGDYRRILTAHREQRDALAERARNAARAEVRHLLRMLAARFPRHRFIFTQGMGSLSVAQIRDGGEGRHARALYLRGDLDNPERDRFPAERERNAYLAAIMRIAETVEEEFNAEVGDVRLDGRSA